MQPKGYTCKVYILVEVMRPDELAGSRHVSAAATHVDARGLSQEDGAGQEARARSRPHLRPEAVRHCSRDRWLVSLGLQGKIRQTISA
jgi:hypothetical protein